MLKREELTRIMSKDNINLTANAAYELFVLTYPELREDSKARFAAAEHMVRKAFSAPAYVTAPSGAFAVFCKQFCLNGADIKNAICHTQEDFETTDVLEVEIAITAVFLWFSQAMRYYGDFTNEFLYFIYAITEPCRGDKELKQQGVDLLAKQAIKKPALFKRIFAILTKC